MIKDNWHDVIGANKDFDQAVKLAPTNSTYLHNRGNTWFDLHDFDKALADMAQVIELNPKNAESA